MPDNDRDYRACTGYYDSQAGEYDAWFDRHPAAFESELRAVRRLIPGTGRGIDIGVGTGRFAAALGIGTGIDPSIGMGVIARKRGIELVCGIAEDLPFADESFDFAFMMTVLLFLHDPVSSIRETYRVVRPGGVLVLAFIDGESFLAEYYEREKSEHGAFYHFVRFHTVDDVVSMLKKAGFGELAFCQTIYSKPEEIDDIQPVKEGYGEGALVIARSVK